MLAYSHSFPMIMYGLVHDDAGQVTAHLKLLERIWRCWQAAEVLAYTDAAVEESLFELIWTSHQSPRSDLILLDEFEFKVVPPSLRDRLMKEAQGPQTTKNTEDVLRGPRKVECLSASNKVSRSVRWNALVHSTVLPEADRPAVKTTQAVTQLSKEVRISNSYFSGEGDLDKFTVPEEVIAKVTGKEEVYRSPSTTNFSLMPLILMMLLVLHDDLALVRNAWRSLLTVKGSLIQDSVTMVGGVVIYVSVYGVLIWKVDRVELGGRNFYRLRSSPDRSNWQFIVLDELEDWHAVRLEGMGPRAIKASLPDILPDDPQPAVNIKMEVMASKVNSKRPLLEFAARHGFPNLTKIHLQKLIRETEAGNVTGTVEQLVNRLCEKILGEGMFDIDEIMALRAGKHTIEVPTVITPENVDLMAEGFDKQEFVDVKKIVQEDAERSTKKHTDGVALRAKRAAKAKAAPKAKSSTTTTRAGSGAKASSSAGSGVPTLTELPLDPNAEEYTVEDIRKYLPPDEVIHVSRDRVQSNRWRVFLPHHNAPNSFGRTFGGALTEFQIVQRCISFCWAVIERDGGPSCPFPDLIGLSPC